MRARTVEDVVIKGLLADWVVREARRRGLTPDEFLAEAIAGSVDPSESVNIYLAASKDLLQQAVEELRRGDVRQAAEKLWGAAALAVKAYALYRDGKRLSSHRELWDYKGVLVKELGEWVHRSWMSANGMRTCFYEGWCAEDDVALSLRDIEKLVEGIRGVVGA